MEPKDHHEGPPLPLPLLYPLRWATGLMLCQDVTLLPVKHLFCLTGQRLKQGQSTLPPFLSMARMAIPQNVPAGISLF
jgi:hypothetical protein